MLLVGGGIGCAPLIWLADDTALYAQGVMANRVSIVRRPVLELPAARGAHLSLDIDQATGTDGHSSPTDVPAFLRPRHE